VVTVYCGGAASSVVAVASGVIVHRDGLVVTTSVVAGQTERVIVTLPDGRQRPARLLGADPGVGLALLKVEGDGLEPIEMSGPGTAAVGDAVLALGDALGLGPTVTQGIISAIRPAQLDGRGETLSFIQTDASVHPGNFGGALVDADGRLVGVTVGTVGPNDAEGLAFAVPAQRVARFITQLQRAAHAEPAHPRTAPERGRFTEVSFSPASIPGRN
jgi:serine protease DegS